MPDCASQSWPLSRSIAPQDEARLKRLAKDLVESEARYFEWGAKSERVPAATVVHMPGLQDVAAGCDVQRVKPALVPEDPGIAEA